jgi:chromosome partitioning protein
MANGLGWPRSDRRAAVVSRETADKAIAPTPETVAADDINEHVNEHLDTTEHADAVEAASTSNEAQASDQYHERAAATTDESVPGRPPSDPTASDGEDQAQSGVTGEPAVVSGHRSIDLTQASGPSEQLSTQSFSSVEHARTSPPTPALVPVNADRGTLENAPAPERQYATADAIGSRVDPDSRAPSSGPPEVRMSPSPESPSTDADSAAISVSVTRPWLEAEPSPAFRHAAPPSEGEGGVPPGLAGGSVTPSSPLIESISLLDDSTPLALEVAEDTRRRIALAGRMFPRPKDTRVITVSNQKGGVGKTTTTVNLAAALAQAGLRVLVLDIDPQGNASTALGIDHHAEVPSVYDVLVEGRPLEEVVQACPDIENLWCAPATIDLAGAEIELVSLVARESRLQRAVTTYLSSRKGGEDRLDYILVDCPPSLGLLTVNAFVAAKEVLIPIQCEYYALEGLSQLLRNVELIKGHLNPDLHVSTILLTMYDGRTRLSSQVADEVRNHFATEVLKTTVPRSVRISEAPSHGQTVMTYDPASSGALSYLEAARELAEQVLGTGGDDAPYGRR